MWPDTATTTDCLGFMSYVETLEEILLRPDLAPVTVGIFGDWGSGKTSLMQMVQDKLRSKPDTVATVWFNPWQFENKEEVQSALIQAILQELEAQLEQRESLSEHATRLFKSLAREASVLKVAKFITKTAVTLTPDIAGFIDCFSDPSRSPATAMRQFSTQFTELLDSAKIARLVVFIDDLDRCQPERALELFETTHLFLGSERCAFVIGADPRKISQAVKHRYPDEARRGPVAVSYLEKVIQIPFRIPEQSLEDISVYVHFLVIGSSVPGDRLDGLRQALLSARSQHANISQAANEWLTQNEPSALTEVQSQLHAIVPHLRTVAGGLRGIPRQIKRFLNILSMRRTLAAKNSMSVGGAVLVKLLVLEYTWPEVFDEVVRSYDPETEGSLLINGLYERYRKAGDRAQDEPGEDGEAEPDVIGRVASTPGLREFLLAAPDLSEINLSPYMFLVQTSANVSHPEALPATAGLVEEVVEGITGGDDFRMRTAIIGAKRLDAGSLQLVVDRCVPIMVGPDANRATIGIKGVDAILDLAPTAMTSVLAAIEEAPMPKGGPLVALAALLEKHARKHDKTPLGKRLCELREKYLAAAPRALKSLVQPRNKQAQPRT